MCYLFTTVKIKVDFLLILLIQTKKLKKNTNFKPTEINQGLLVCLFNFGKYSPSEDDNNYS